MVEVRASRLAAEVLADEGLVADVTRMESQAAGLLDDNTGEVRASRASIEVLAAEPGYPGVTRVEVQAAGLHTGAVEAQVSRISMEVLASPDDSAAVTRVEIQAAGLHTGAVEAEVSRISLECLARQGSAGLVEPLDLADDISVFLHNWVTRAELTSSFRTSVTYSPATAAEARRGLTVKPYRTMKLEWMVCDGLDLTRLERIEVLLRRIGNERFQVPIYMDQQELDASYISSDTTINVPTRRARFFAGARAVIVQLDAFGQPASFSFHVIESMTNTSLTFDATLGVAVPAGSLVFPVMDCEIILDVEAEYATSRVPVVRMTVAEAPGASQLPPLKSDNPTGASQYDGRPIWYTEPDWSTGITKGRSRYGNTTQEGRAPFVHPEGDRSRQTHKYVLNGTREDMWNVLEFFETRRGRLRSFWHIDQDQYLIAVSLDASGTFIGIDPIGDLADFSEEMDYIGLIMEDGTYYVREAVTIQEILGVFRVTVDVPVGLNLDTADVVRVARARASRFDSDAFTEVWTHTGYMTCSVEIVEALNEGNVSTT